MKHSSNKIFNSFLIKFCFIIFLFGFFFFGQINTTEAATRTWTGTTSGLWSVASNWGGTAPVTGDDLVFPIGASNLSNTNDLTESTIINSITISGSGYTLSGNTIILGPGLAGITDSVASGGNTIALDIRFDVTRDIVVTNVTESLTISGRITGVGGFNKEGNGTLVLSGANTYGGVTKINVGVVNARNSTALGTIALGTEVVGNAALHLQGSIDISYETLALRGYGISSDGALRNISGDNTYGGLITMIAGGAEIASDSGTLTLTGGMAGTFPLVIDGVGNVAYSKTPIGIAGGTVTKNGTGTLTYNFPNTYTGLTTINAGTLAYGVDNAILTGSITVTGGTLDIGTFSDMVGFVTLGTLDLASGTITGSTGMLTSRDWTVLAGTISAIIAGDAVALTKTTTGTVTLTRANQYTGVTNVNAGILKVQNSTALGVIDGITTVAAGATLQIDGNGFSIPEYITLSGTGRLFTGAIRNMYGDNTLTGLLTLSAAAMIKSDIGTTLTINSKGLNAGSSGLTISGDGNTTFTATAPIYGLSATLTKNDSGTLTVGSFSNYTGATTINKGLVVLSGNGSILRSTAMTINTAGRLVVDNTAGTINRLSDILALTMNGGDFDLYGSSSGNVFSISGGLNISTGQNRITIHPGSGGATILRFASFTRSSSASALFRGIDFGSTPGIGVSTLRFATAPTTVGGDGAPGSPTLNILQGVFGDNSLTGSGTDMVTYDRGGSGIRLLNGAGYSNEYTSDLSVVNANIKLTASTVAATATINSLILSSSGAIADAGTSQIITFTSGNLLNLVSNTTIAGVNTTLASGTLDFSLRTVENLTISADITSSGGITKSGTNMLTFSTAKSYTGTTDINRGILKYGVDNAILSGAITVNSGTLDIDQYDDTVGVVTLNDGTITGTTGILTATSYSVREGTISAIIAGSGSLTKINTATSVDATVLLTRNNTYIGTTIITSGILKLGAAGNGINSPLGTINGGTTIASIAALDLNGFTLSIPEAITSLNGLGFGAGSTVAAGNSNMGGIMNTSGTAVSYSGNITLGSASRINADFGEITITGNMSGAFLFTVGGNSNIIYSGVRSASAGLTKDGFGTLTLSGDNSYAGITTISSGTLKLGANGGGTNTPLGTTAGITTISLGARFDLNGFTLGTAEPTTLNGVGYGLGDFASGALINSSGSSVTYSGLITLGSASTIKVDSGDINLTAAGTITGATIGLTLGGTGTGSLSSIIGTTTGTVTKIDTGTWILSGVSTYTSATTINRGTLKLGAAGGAINTPLGTITGTTTVLSGGALDLNGFSLGTAETLIINGRGISDTGAIVNTGAAVTFLGSITQATDSRIENSGSGLLTLSGAVGGLFTLMVDGTANTTFGVAIPTAALILTKQGSGTLTLTGTNLNTGETRVEGGTLRYGAATTLATTNLMMKGGIFDMNAIADTIGTVTLIGGTISNGTLTAATSYTLESGTISAVLAGAIPTTKNTNNTVTLTGANTISSTTTINAGTLTLSGSGSAVSTTITVNLDATLTLDNTSTAVASRLGDALALTMNGGNFNFIGNTAGTSSELTGALNLLTGHNTVTITPGSGGSTTMTFASLSRTAGATVLFRGTSLGTAAAANISTLMFTATPTLIGAGGASNTATVSVIKGAFGDTSLSGSGSDMVTYQGGTGLRLLNGAGFSGEYSTTLTTNTNVKLTANTAASTVSINSLILNGFGITNPGGAVTLSIAAAALSGNVLINSATDIAGANTTLGITTFELPILATANSTISAIIGTATTGSLTLSGSGNITLSAANLYTSTTFINNATLTAGVNNALSSGGVTMRGGLYDLNDNSDTVGAISLTAGTITTGAGTLTGSGSFVTSANNNFASIITGNLGLGANATFTIADGLMDNDAVITAVISGNFTFVKAGTGILMLSGSNTYSQATSISTGTLRLGATGGATNTPLGTTAGITTVSSSSAALDLNGYILGTAEALTLNGALATGALQNTSSTAVTYSGLITLSSAGTIISNYGDINITNTGNITGNTFALTIGGAGNGTLASNLNTTTGTLTKNGFGVWTVSGASSFTGLTTVSAGTLKLGATGSGANTPLGTVAGITSITSGAIFDLNGFTLATAEPLTISGAGIANIGSLINSSNNSISYSGAITLSPSPRVVNYGNGVLTLTGNISGSSQILTIVTVGDITQSSTSVWSGTSLLVKEGSGTLILAGQNSMTGTMTVSTGTIQLGANGGVTNTPLGTIAGSVTVSTGAVLDLSTFTVGGATTWEPLLISGSGLSNGGALISNSVAGSSFATVGQTTARIVNNGAGALTFTGAVTGASTLWIGGSGPTTISGALNTAGLFLTKYGAGTLTLSSISNINTSLVRINAGTLAYGVNDALSTPTLTVAGGTLNLAGFNETNIGAVTLIDGSIINSGGAATLTSTTTYTVENGNISAVLGGAAIAFNKNTGGTVTLSAANTFAGLTTINAGTLAWGINDALSSGSLTVVGGIADLVTYTDTVATVTLTNGAIDSSTGILTGTSYAAASGTISAILAGAVNLTKTTTGTVALSGVNTYTGITTISGGTLSVGTIGNGGAGGSNLGNASNAAANIVFNTATGTLQYTGTTASTDRAYTTTNAITTQFDITDSGAVLTWGGAGPVTTALISKIGPGTLNFSTPQGHTGLTTVLGGTLQYGVNNTLSTGTVTVNNGTLDINNFSDSVGIITLQNDGQIIDSGGTTAVLTTTGTMAAQSGTVSARLGGSTASGISKTTNGRVILLGDNNFTSTSIVLSAGYLNLQNNNALGASGTTLTTTITSGAVLELQDNITLPNTKLITANGTGVSNMGAIRNISGSNTIGGNIALGSSNTSINSNSGTLTFPTVSGNALNVILNGAGDISITGAISTTSGSLTKNGNGTLTLTGANTYTGTTTITAGTIIANASTALGNGSVTNTLIFNGGTLKASGTITSPSNRAVTILSTAIFDTDGNNASFAGTFGSAAGLTKNGAGSLTISGTTTLGGDLVISAGTFVSPTSLTITGNFSNSGTFTHNNGTITIAPSNPISGIINILGSSNTSFYNFTNVTADSTLQFKAGNTYTFSNLLTLTGSNNDPISLNSDIPSSQWLMTLSGASSISYLKVKDSGCSGGNNVPASDTISNQGNNGACWLFYVTHMRRGGGIGNIEVSINPDSDQGGGGSGGGDDIG